MSSCALSLTETRAQATWLRPKGWLRHTSEQLINCSQLSGVKELISENWHLLILFLKRQVRLLFLFTNSQLLYFETAPVVAVSSHSVSTLPFFSDFTSIFNHDRTSSNPIQPVSNDTHKEDFVISLLKQDTLPLENCFWIFAFDWDGWPVSTNGGSKWLLHPTWKCLWTL